ncbi:MAG: hypothetical protein Ct9H300mP28_02330 [Pseudomonadota bacterium]|nr:MAG: hypothetical protein Ct9H300mP28_02330 [Pseudomonadota bacterium]
MNSISITGKMHPGFDNILTEEAQDFILKLHQKFSGTRKSCWKNVRKFTVKSCQVKCRDF